MEEGKPVIIDFYADWCRPCVAMEKEVFTDPEVIKLSRNCVTVRLDLTIEQPFHREVLKKYGVRGIPTVVFINRNGVEDKQLRIKGHAGKSEFLDRLKRLLEGPSST